MEALNCRILELHHTVRLIPAIPYDFQNLIRVGFWCSPDSHMGNPICDGKLDIRTLHAYTSTFI